MSRIYVLGVGPGGPDLLPPRSVELAGKCDVLFGGKRNLELFNALAVEKRPIGRDINGLLATIEASYRLKQVGVLVSGDPGLFSLLAALRRRFDPTLLEVVPAPSALQCLFARISLPWHDAAIISVHGRQQEELARELVTAVQHYAKTGVFTDGKNTPALVCKLLLEKGVQNCSVYIGENLSYPEEKIYTGSLEKCCSSEVEPLNVMVIINESKQ